MNATTRNTLLFAALLACLSPALAAGLDKPVQLEREACALPDYPSRWQNEDQQGAVKLALLVGADGQVQEAKILESSGYGNLDKASLRAISQCKFQPATSNGQMTAAWTKVQYSWVIN